MSTDADELAKTVGGITLRQIGLIVVACGAFMAAVSAIVAGYAAVGGPVPATRQYVAREVVGLEQKIQVLADAQRQTQQLVLSDKWWRLEQKIEDLAGESPELVRRLKRDQSDVQKQIDRLD